MAETIRGLTIKIGADTQEFQKGIKLIDREISETNKQVNALTKSLELDFNEGRFIQAQKLAADSIEKTETKAKALREQLKFLDETGADKTSTSYQKLQTQLIKTETDAVILKKRLEEIQKLQVEKLAKSFEDAGKEITKLGNALTPLSTAAAGLLVGLGSVGLNAVKSADDLKTFADQVNLSAEELQRWRYIAMQTDVSSQELQTGFVRIQQALGDLSRNELNASSKAIQSLGITTEQARKGMSANFSIIIKAISDIQDPLEQSAVATELFGNRIASRLIPLLKDGSAGLDELSKEFENLGFITNEQIDELSDFDNELNRVKYSFGLIVSTLGISLLPIMERLTDFINKNIIPAVQGAVKWFTDLDESQKELLITIISVIAGLAPLLLIIGSLTEGIGGVIRTVSSLSSAFVALLANPIVAGLAAIVAIIALLYTTNEEFRDSINRLVSQLGTSLMPVLDSLWKVFGVVLNALMPIINAMAQIFIPIIEILAAVLIPVVNILSALLVPALNNAANSLGFVSNLVRDFVNIITNTLTPVLNGLRNLVDTVFSFLVNKIQTAVSAVSSLINTFRSLLGLSGTTQQQAAPSGMGQALPPDQQQRGTGSPYGSGPTTTAQNAVTSTNTTGTTLGSSTGMGGFNPNTTTNNVQVTINNNTGTIDYERVTEAVNRGLAFEIPVYQ